MGFLGDLGNLGIGILGLGAEAIKDSLFGSSEPSDFDTPQFYDDDRNASDFIFDQNSDEDVFFKLANKWNEIFSRNFKIESVKTTKGDPFWYFDSGNAMLDYQNDGYKPSMKEFKCKDCTISTETRHFSSNESKLIDDKGFIKDEAGNCCYIKFYKNDKCIDFEFGKNLNANTYYIRMTFEKAASTIFICKSNVSRALESYASKTGGLTGIVDNFKNFSTFLNNEAIKFEKENEIKRKEEAERKKLEVQKKQKQEELEKQREIEQEKRKEAEELTNSLNDI